MILNYKFSDDVLMILVKILIILSISFKYNSTSTWTRLEDWYNFNQYFVSLASLFAIESFEIKSFLDWAAIASSTFAPIEVPQRRICLDNINSFWDLQSE